MNTLTTLELYAKAAKVPKKSVYIDGKYHSADSLINRNKDDKRYTVLTENENAIFVTKSVAL